MLRDEGKHLRSLTKRCFSYFHFSEGRHICTKAQMNKRLYQWNCLFYVKPSYSTNLSKYLIFNIEIYKCQVLLI
jgi:hypothetical protein